MPSLRNKTKKPLTVPLPGGKKLRLGPGKTGQVTPKALEHPAVQRLAEEGELEIIEADGPRARGGAGGASGGRGPAPGREPSAGGGIQQSGDR